MHADITSTLCSATQAALNGDWDQSHRIVQEINHPMANWLHAVLHKMEGDEWNSRYWYARCANKHFEDFNEPMQELKAILDKLGQSSP